MRGRDTNPLNDFSSMSSSSSCSFLRRCRPIVSSTSRVGLIKFSLLLVAIFCLGKCNQEQLRTTRAKNKGKEKGVSEMIVPSSLLIRALSKIYQVMKIRLLSSLIQFAKILFCSLSLSRCVTLRFCNFIFISSLDLNFNKRKTG
jgi:hypothetical protein